MKGLDKMLNNVMLSGRLTANPNLTDLDNSKYCKFRIAVKRPRRKNEETPETDFFNCIAWNKNASIICDWYKKGDIVMIAGNLRNHRYEKNNEARISTEILVKEIYFTNNKKTTNTKDETGFDYKIFEEIFADEEVPF